VGGNCNDFYFYRSMRHALRRYFGCSGAMEAKFGLQESTTGVGRGPQS